MDVLSYARSSGPRFIALVPDHERHGQGGASQAETRKE